MESGLQIYEFFSFEGAAKVIFLLQTLAAGSGKRAYGKRAYGIYSHRVDYFSFFSLNLFSLSGLFLPLPSFIISSFWAEREVDFLAVGS